jgi:hypothetical protein
MFNVDTDNIYHALINDKDGTIPSTINKPTDIDIGVIASQIEYLRQLSITLLKQMFADQADTEFLEFILETFFDSFRLVGETDEEWLDRVISIIFLEKVSTTSIIVLLRIYSTLEPVVTNLTEVPYNAYADFSYADFYASGSTTLDGETIHYVTAFSDTFESAFYAIKITLYNSSPNEIIAAQDVISKIIAAGIYAYLEIIYT